MGPALAYAFAARSWEGLLVFIALGLGLAAPFLLIAFVPAVAAWLPRPGAWMDAFKRLLAFPMLFTAAWLLWVLGGQRGHSAMAIILVASLILGLALWIYEHAKHAGNGKLYWFSIFLLLLTLTTPAAISRLPQVAPKFNAPSSIAGAIAFSPKQLSQLRNEERSVLLIVTADWCATGIANQHLVLGTNETRRILEESQTVLMKADYTSEDPAIAALLEQHKAPGVPLYLHYMGSAEPTRLPGVLSKSTLRKQLMPAQ